MCISHTPIQFPLLSSILTDCFQCEFSYLAEPISYLKSKRNYGKHELTDPEGSRVNSERKRRRTTNLIFGGIINITANNKIKIELNCLMELVFRYMSKFHSVATIKFRLMF